MMLNEMFKGISIRKLVLVYIISLIAVTIVLDAAMPNDYGDSLWFAVHSMVMMIWFLKLMLRGKVHLRYELTNLGEKVQKKEVLGLTILNIAFSMDETNRK